MTHHSTGAAAALCRLLQAEAAVFAELAELAAAQRRALLGADEEALVRLAGRAETLATQFRLLDDERRRLESDPAPPDADVERARAALTAALAQAVRESAISGTVLERLGDAVASRGAAVGGLFGATYLPDGRPAAAGAAGGALSLEG